MCLNESILSLKADSGSITLPKEQITILFLLLDTFLTLFLLQPKILSNLTTSYPGSFKHLTNSAVKIFHISVIFHRKRSLIFNVVYYNIFNMFNNFVFKAWQLKILVKEDG